MKRILIVNAERDWVDRAQITDIDMLIAIDEQGREYDVKFTSTHGWVIIRENKVAYQPNPIQNNFLDFFDNKPKGFKVYLHR